MKLMHRDSQDSTFYTAVLCGHSQDFEQANTLRDLPSPQSYEGAYHIIVWGQKLAWMEEVIEYKQVPCGAAQPRRCGRKD